MSEQVGWRALLDNLNREAPQWATIMPKLPSLIYKVLDSQQTQQQVNNQIDVLLKRQKKQEKRTRVFGLALLMCLSSTIYFYFN